MRGYRIGGGLYGRTEGNRPLGTSPVRAVGMLGIHVTRDILVSQRFHPLEAEDLLLRALRVF